MSKADDLVSLANEVALELRAAQTNGTLTFDEFKAILGDDWLCWLPENEGNPRDWQTTEEHYVAFCTALKNYRETGDPSGWSLKVTSDE
jgi:hypothetical protein